ncbi:MAG: GNAT family N-acyltransferase [Litoreibacter sp.]
MIALERGEYEVRPATSADDVSAALALRAQVFRGGSDDGDAFDQRCEHIIVKNRSGAMVCCFRVLHLSSGRKIEQSYSAQFYGLDRLGEFKESLLEIGRFCLAPSVQDPEVLRTAWAALTRYVDQEGIGMLFGCSSFAGGRRLDNEATFNLLAARHLAPDQWAPAVKAKTTHALTSGRGALDLKKGMQAMPPLLRTYIAMGGWVSDHAVIDADLGTLHVFTGLEIGQIPPTRKRLLRALAS